jgi:hypothetical protein
MAIRTSSVLGFVVASCVTMGVVLGDADSAKKYLKEAQANIDSSDLSAATTSLQLAETELDGVDDATKAPIAKDIADLKAKIDDAQNSAKNADMVKDIDSRMENAKRDLDAPGFNDDDKDISDFLGRDDVKSALGPDAVAKYLKELSTFRKVANAKAFARNLDLVKQNLDDADKDWATAQASMQNSTTPAEEHPEVVTFSNDLDRIEPYIKTFPTDKPAAVEQINRFKKLQAVYNAAIAQSKAAETFSRLKDSWAGYADEYGSWDKETTAPSLNDLLHNQSDAMSSINCPKSVALVTRANSWLNDLKDDQTVQAVGDTDPQLKGLLGGIRTDRLTAYRKLAKFAAAILDEAEKTQLNQEGRDRLETFANDDLRRALDGYDQQKPLQQRALKLVAAYDQKAGGDAAAKAKLYDTLCAQATKAWPAMATKLGGSNSLDAVSASQNIDPVKGQTILLKAVSNRMGWEFRPGAGYDFAMMIDGVPVAGKYDSAIHDAADSVGKRTDRDFSDEQYDVVATVEGLGPIVKITRAQGTINADNGEKLADVTAQRDETVQGIRLKIIGIHVGPLAAAVGQGAVDENGNVVP